VSHTVSLSQFSGGNAGECLAAAMEFLQSNPGSTLVVEPGIYELSTPLARQTMANTLSGAYGENPQDVLFTPDFAYSRGISLDGQQDSTIVADGVTLLVEGFMEPLSLTNCRNITIRGLTIDHKRKPFSMGAVTKVEWATKTSGCFTVVFGQEYPLSEHSPMPRNVFYSPVLDRFVGYNTYQIVSREQIALQQWRFGFDGMNFDPSGMEFYVWHSFHFRPAIRIEEAHNITLENVTIHSQPGMGVVAHRSSDIRIDGLRVVPSAGLHMSTNTDATHFTSCSGLVRIENSVFEGQGDDCINIHSYYHSIVHSKGSLCTTWLEAPDKTHTQTADSPAPGDLLELTDMRSLECRSIYRVMHCEPYGPWQNMLVLDRPLPPDCTGLAFINITRMPRLEFVANICRNHIARSVLVKIKKALIENNTISDATGTGIYAAAEAEWFEGLCTTENIVIRQNRITNCGRTAGSGRKNGAGGICITVDADEATAATHAHVEVCDNVIDCPDAPHGIYISNTSESVLEGNRIVSKDMPIVRGD